MRIDLTAFGGALPKKAAHLLQGHEAQDAANARLESGDLEPLNATSQVSTLEKLNVSSIYRYAGQYWFQWKNAGVRVVRGPVPGDTEERTYWTGDGDPKMTYAAIATSGLDADYPDNWYRLGVPAPATAPTLTITQGPAGEDVLAESRAYVYTYVSGKGEEGPPSPPSDVKEWQEGDTADLSNMDGAPTGNYNITKKRIYRTNTAESGPVYQFVAEIDVANTAYTDSVATEDLGEIIPSTDWDQPPSDLDGLTVLSNGVLAGFSKNELCFSDPYLPHAWPVGYRLSTDYPIVGIGALGLSVVVATEGEPYIASAVDPRAADMQKMEIPYPCMSGRSVVEMGSSVVYAADDGLVAVTGRGPQKVTEQILSQKQWRALKPSSMHAYRWDDKYVCFYDNGTTQGGFMIDSRGQQFAYLDFYATGGWTDPATGDLFLVVNNAVHQFNAGAALTMRWKSASFKTGPRNFSVAQVRAESLPVHVKVWADGALKYDADVSSEDPFLLPGGFLASTWEVELSGTNRVHCFEMAESAEELRL